LRWFVTGSQDSAQDLLYAPPKKGKKAHQQDYDKWQVETRPAPKASPKFYNKKSFSVAWFVNLFVLQFPSYRFSPGFVYLGLLGSSNNAKRQSPDYEY
jgi:hypothetical protein